MDWQTRKRVYNYAPIRGLTIYFDSLTAGIPIFLMNHRLRTFLAIAVVCFAGVVSGLFAQSAKDLYGNDIYWNATPN